jgi:hypothetical protein
MSPSTILGLIGDALTFTGALILALDALRRQTEFRKTKQLQKAVESLDGIKLTQDGIVLLNNESVELVLIRQSVKRALWGAGILTLGFIFLLATRIIELIAQLTEHLPANP